MFRSKEPEFIKALKAHIEKWEKYPDGSIVVYPQKACFSKMFIRSIPVFIGLEFKNEFSAISEIVPQENMNESSRQLYRRLKRFECELSWYGLLKTKPVFETSPTLKDLQVRIPDLRPDDTIIKVLNSDRKLTKNLKKIKPSLEVYLWSLQTALIPYDEPQSKLNAMTEFYHNPSRIAWIARLASMVSSKSINYNRNINRIFGTLDRVCKITKYLSTNVKFIN